jgi:hypothetical protein
MLRCNQSAVTTNFVYTLKDVKLKVKLSHYRPGQGSRRLRLPKFLDKFVKLTFPSLTLQAESTASRRIRSMKNSNNTMGNRTRDLPTAPPRVPNLYDAPDQNTIRRSSFWQSYKFHYLRQVVTVVLLKTLKMRLVFANTLGI